MKTKTTVQNKGIKAVKAAVSILLTGVFTALSARILSYFNLGWGEWEYLSTGTGGLLGAFYGVLLVTYIKINRKVFLPSSNPYGRDIFLMGAAMYFPTMFGITAFVGVFGWIVFPSGFIPGVLFGGVFLILAAFLLNFKKINKIGNKLKAAEEKDELKQKIEKNFKWF